VRIRKAGDEAELTAIEEEVDIMLRAQLARADRDEAASDLQAMIAAAHRIDHLIHQRRTLLANKEGGECPLPAAMPGDGS
jgi:hypothetical protein